MTQKLNVKSLGQVFTEQDTVQQMLSLKRNSGPVLEPSAGNGAFSSLIPGCVALELDESVAKPGMLVMDFFDYPVSEKFDTVIGNPPYVKNQLIDKATRSKLPDSLFDDRSNLFLHFIYKAVLHLNEGGELIFIVPREMAKLTSARKLNAWLMEQGSFTHFIETGDARLFKGASPNCVIFRYVKGLQATQLEDGRHIQHQDGQLSFPRSEAKVPFGALFEVRVGAVSGADAIFYHPEGETPFICAGTRKTGKTKQAFYGQPNPHLELHKDALLARRVRKFDESNWWQWGRGLPKKEGPRIYVNVKTRLENPFFLHDCPNFDGSVLALYPKTAMPLEKMVDYLNKDINWLELGFKCDGRYLFSQRALQNTCLPSFM